MVNTEELKRKELRKYKLKNNLYGYLMVLPFVLIFIVFSLVPFISGIVMSFMKYNPYNSLENEFIGLKNYMDLFEGLSNVKSAAYPFWKSFGSMLLFDLMTIPFLIVIPLALAYLIHLEPPGYKFFRAIIYIPCVFSISIVGVIFCNIFASDSSGLINSLFGMDIKWLSGKPFENDELRWIVMLIASIWWQTGSNFVIFTGALKNVPKSLYEACEVDGAGRWKRILYVTLPNIKPTIAICLFNTLIGYLGLYGQPTVLNDSTNKNEYFAPMQYLQKFLSNQTYVAKKTGFICACGVAFGVIVLIFSIIERKATGEKKIKNRFCKDYAQYISCKKEIALEVDE